jgi:hypothetical protein
MAMESLLNVSWRLYLVLPLMALGAVLAVWGAKRGRTGLLGAWRGNAAMLVPLMIGFRACIIGVALIGVSAAWVWHLPWLLIVSLATAGGETLETSLILFALRHGKHLEIGRSRARSPGRSPASTDAPMASASIPWPDQGDPMAPLQQALRSDRWRLDVRTLCRHIG